MTGARLWSYLYFNLTHSAEWRNTENSAQCDDLAVATLERGLSTFATTRKISAFRRGERRTMTRAIAAAGTLSAYEHATIRN
jgi:hypothetical protein